LRIAVARYFLDSNIFLYAMGTEHPETGPCRRLLAMIAAGEMEAVTSSEVLQEVLYVRLRRGARTDALASVGMIRDLIGEILPVTAADVGEACGLLEKYPALDARDAVHAAVAKRAKIALLISVDKDFERIKGLHRVGPADVIS
jgi:predicted nucleic acid-binding protein